MTAVTKLVGGVQLEVIAELVGRMELAFGLSPSWQVEGGIKLVIVDELVGKVELAIVAELVGRIELL